MPAPQASAMQQLAKQKFMSFGLVIPSDWKQPQGEKAKLYQDAFDSPDHNRPDTSNRLFRPASTNIHHIDATKEIGKIYGDFIDDMCSAICGAIGNWMTAAVIPSVIITNVNSASRGNCGGSDPCVPSLNGSASNDSVLHCSSHRDWNCVASLVHWIFEDVAVSPDVCSLPESLPSSDTQHPHTLGVREPRRAQMMQTAALKASMIGLHGNPSAPFSSELFESLAEAFSTTFNLWTTSTLVCNVMGSGPNPLFVPPAPVPGPVLGGFGFGAPGCIS